LVACEGPRDAAVGRAEAGEQSPSPGSPEGEREAKVPLEPQEQPEEREAVDESSVKC